ncbi:DUF6174 domain-containing protein [Actinoplanes sp. NPDC051475]|uniref:DUF6174 domain-containing protein n=1 Tax=Actinoplanes sp. NPDC051475 TaxID=3157225 RepID=UPI00344B8B95
MEGTVRRLIPCAVFAVLLGGCAQPQAQPQPAVGAAAPATWTVPDKYAFTLTSECGERALLGTFRVTVVGDEVTRAEGLDDAARRALMLRLANLVPTLHQLEAQAEAAKKDGADVVEVEREPSDAHPTRIMIDRSSAAEDDEECYTIRDYTIGLAAEPSATPSR